MTKVSTPQPMNDPRAHLPAFYDDLDATRLEAWRFIARGAVDRRSPLHSVAVATIATTGAPQVRTVVLRGVDIDTRTLRFHTDQRSGKVAELTADPRISLLGYDAGHKVQLRFSGTARLAHGNDVARAAWERSQPMSRMCYRQAAAPGRALADPTQPGINADGFENFVVVTVAVTQLEWLYLAAQGHRRAHFSWSPDGALVQTWLAP